jgi:hypothetical protein
LRLARSLTHPTNSVAAALWPAFPFFAPPPAVREFPPAFAPPLAVFVVLAVAFVPPAAPTISELRLARSPTISELRLATLWPAFPFVERTPPFFERSPVFAPPPPAVCEFPPAFAPPLAVFGLLAVALVPLAAYPFRTAAGPLHADAFVYRVPSAFGLASVPMIAGRLKLRRLALLR